MNSLPHRPSLSSVLLALASLALLLLSLRSPAAARRRARDVDALFWNGASLPTPPECGEWRAVARDEAKLRLYRKHFLSHDVTDWFLYAALFTDAWHAARAHNNPASAAAASAPVYVDIAANHARRWSSTWFLDRCLGWRGLCVEANRKYWPELAAHRTCRLAPHCLSDRPRRVRFSRADAYGGVVAAQEEDEDEEGAPGKYGVNGTAHAHDAKFRDKFTGFEDMQCTTVAHLLRRGRHLGLRSGGKVHVHFLNLDVEGHEVPVVNGIDWDSVRIDVIVTENRTPEMRAILKRRGYSLHERILKDDLWIDPASNMTLDPAIVSLMGRFNRAHYNFSA